MRVARITGEGESYYHVLSRVVDRRLILDDAERERFQRLMRDLDAFSGCQVLTWAALGTGTFYCACPSRSRSTMMNWNGGWVHL